jgi:vacuolar-type H+-ATPase subunit H
MTDFLSQVQEAEQNAAAMLEKAITRNQNSIRKYKAELAEEQKKKEEIAQEEMKESIQADRAKRRQSYESQMHEGESEASKLETERTAQIKPILPEATTLLLDLL